VDDWVRLPATAAETPVTDAFVRDLAVRAPTWGRGRSQRLTDVLTRLGPPETQRTWPRAQQLLLDGLRLRVARMNPAAGISMPAD
jgi:hypothetical protein